MAVEPVGLREDDAVVVGEGARIDVEELRTFIVASGLLEQAGAFEGEVDLAGGDVERAAVGLDGRVEVAGAVEGVA